MNDQDLIDKIKTRRSIRKWTNQKIPRNIIDEIINCGLKAPSAYGTSPWELIIVDDDKVIKKLLLSRLQLKEPPYFINSSKYVDKLGKEKYEKVTQPPLLIVITGDKKKCYNDMQGLIASLACCGENMLLASHLLGLGACWLFVIDDGMPQIEKEVKDILHIPNEYIALSMLAIGYPNETPSKKTKSEQKIHQNVW